ncbi:hypothetical protein [Methanolobus sp. WCC4]|uniref:hypothetical protein n=1 Tax=Methanolobus sp. WCC4 TaxID=3125784 RepID=UPI0030FA2E68
MKNIDFLNFAEIGIVEILVSLFVAALVCILLEKVVKTLSIIIKILLMIIGGLVTLYFLMMLNGV